MLDIDILLKEIRAKKLNSQPEASIPIEQRCLVSPWLTWERRVVEDLVECVLPDDLLQLWNKTSGIVLFQDMLYGQWGLVLWSPDQAILRHKRYMQLRPDQYEKGDFIIGEFLGDSDLLIIRCDPTAPDFGNIIIGLPIDKRVDWYHPSDTLLQFIRLFLENNGDKFWESH